MEKIIEEQLTRTYSNGLTGKEIIRRITEVYNAGYNFNDPDFDIYEQLLVCESMAETEAGEFREYGSTRENVSVNGNGNDTCKLIVNSVLADNKLNAINALKVYTYLTPEYKVTEALSEIFYGCNSYSYLWSFVANNYTVRSINQVLAYMIKRYGNWSTLQNSAKYFITSIRFRKPKKSKSGFRKKI